MAQGEPSSGKILGGPAARVEGYDAGSEVRRSKDASKRAGEVDTMLSGLDQRAS